MPTLMDTVSQQAQSAVTKTSSRVTRLKSLRAASSSKNSDLFHLVNVDISKLPLLFAAGAPSDGPLVVDRNFDKVARLNCSYVPSVIILGGINKLREAKRNEDMQCAAWVGEAAIKRLNIHAADAISNSDLEDKLRQLITDTYGKKAAKNNYSDTPYMESPYVRDVYQGTSNYVIFRMGKAFFRQNFKVDYATRNISLDGAKTEVVQSYVDAPTGDLTSAGWQPTVGALANSTLAQQIYQPSLVKGGWPGPIMMEPGLGGVDFVSYGAPGSEANNPVYATMSNVEEALAQFLDVIKYGFHKPTGQLGLTTVTPQHINAAAETRIALKAHPEIVGEQFPMQDFLRWQHRKLEGKAIDQTKLVHGEPLMASDFAYVGDPRDISTWHLPMASPAHIANSLQAASSCTAIPKFERAEVREKLEAKARVYGVNAPAPLVGRVKKTKNPRPVTVA